jgi:enoyl-CoA hydratase/carnithine racemase
LKHGVDRDADSSRGCHRQTTPPVNALKHEVRAGLVEVLSQAIVDNGVMAVVLAYVGRTFSAVADITEGGEPSRPRVYLRWSPEP